MVLLYLSVIDASGHKILKSNRSNSKITIDGLIDETIWQDLQVATNFTMLSPGNGLKPPKDYKTEVQITYDDMAIYIAAKLYYKNEKEIKKEFSSRDDIYVEADVFSFAVNTYNDGVNEVKFHVTAAGIQADSKTSKANGSDDFSWNAVWESAVKIHSNQLDLEIKIPYSALRFQNTKKHIWGINFIRSIRSIDQAYSWNFINRTIGRQAQYNGELQGISNITPPVRLSFFPFVSSMSTISKDSKSMKINTGLDLKYGISESFTLDATLIPDFGQTALDELKLNLGPYEQTYKEKRQFFVEGMELFNKGDLFYSRRIGGKSLARRPIAAQEEIDKLPEEIKILNVFKISGRNNKGLGIGFLNAITQSNRAIIKNLDNNISTQQTIDPFTNYNVLSIDQQFNNNSSISFTNTSVLRKAHFRDANATALSYDISNKKSTYKVDGNIRYSNINDQKKIEGIASKINLRKIAGNFRFRLSYNINDDKFNIKDFGRQNKNNFHYISSSLSYDRFTPQGRFNSYHISLNSNIQHLYNPYTYTNSNLGIYSYFKTKHMLGYTFSAYINPRKTYDYNETRTNNRYLIKNRKLYLHTQFNSDSGKYMYINTSFTYNNRLHNDESTYNFVLRPRIRFSDKFNINYCFKKSLTKAQAGYIENTDDEILFGKRKIDEIENNIILSYNYNVKHSASLQFRNYWTTVQYSKGLFSLSQNGSLNETNLLASDDPDTNFQTWNFDFRYSWLFAPGSEMMFLYRNSIYQNTNNAQQNYTSSVNDLFSQDLNHTISLKITYYIDYNNMKNLFSKTNS